MPVPTTSVTETFDGENAGSLPGWDGNSLSLGGTNFGRESNVGVLSNNYDESSQQGDVGPDLEVFAQFTVLVADGGDFGLHWGLTNQGLSTSHCYRLSISKIAGSSNDVWQFQRKDTGSTAGAIVNVGASVAREFSAGDIVWAKRVGATHTIYHAPSGDPTNFTLVMTRTDGTYTAAGRCGAYGYSNGGGFAIDNFGRGTLSGDTLPANTAAPAITGTPQVDETLTVSVGTWSGSPTPTITRKWQRSDNGSTGWTDISGQTGTSYDAAAGDADKYLSVLESATNTEGTVTQRSNVVGPVAAAPPIVVSIRLTGGSSNTDLAASYRGVASTTELPVATPPAEATANGLLDEVTAAERNSGFTEYRCVAVTNEDADRDAQVTAWLSQVPGGGDFTLRIGAGPEAAGENAESIANDHTAPAGVSFIAAASADAGVVLTVPASSHCNLWLRRATTAGADPSTGNEWAIQFDVTPDG